MNVPIEWALDGVISVEHAHVQVHSANPVGRECLLGTLDSFLRRSRTPDDPQSLDRS